MGNGAEEEGAADAWEGPPMGGVNRCACRARRAVVPRQWGSCKAGKGFTEREASEQRWEGRMDAGRTGKNVCTW